MGIVTEPTAATSATEAPVRVPMKALPITTAFPPPPGASLYLLEKEG